MAGSLTAGPNDSLLDDDDVPFQSLENIPMATSWKINRLRTLSSSGITRASLTYGWKRLLYLGKANLTPEEVVLVGPRQVLNFFGSLELP